LDDELAIFDLAGLTPDATPNPNVMYELGVRHAFQLPSVIFGWEGQRLPFDVGTQRAVLVARDMEGITAAREKMIDALKNAKTGRFYNPLQRRAQAKQIAEEVRHEPALNLLADSVYDLREDLKKIRKFLDPRSGEIEREALLQALDLGVDEKTLGEWGPKPPPPDGPPPEKVVKLMEALRRSLDEAAGRTTTRPKERPPSA
jgi:hypothetical protein